MLGIQFQVLISPPDSWLVVELPDRLVSFQQGPAGCYNIFLLSLSSAGPGLAAVTGPESQAALIPLYQMVHSQPEPSPWMKGSASGACGGWWGALLAAGEMLFLPSQGENQFLASSCSGWRDCLLGLTKGLAVISELAGLHQEEGTYRLPPGGGDLAEEQCACPGEQGSACVLLVFTGI